MTAARRSRGSPLHPAVRSATEPAGRASTDPRGPGCVRPGRRSEPYTDATARRNCRSNRAAGRPRDTISCTNSCRISCEISCDFSCASLTHIAESVQVTPPCGRGRASDIPFAAALPMPWLELRRGRAGWAARTLPGITARTQPVARRWGRRARAGVMVVALSCGGIGGERVVRARCRRAEASRARSTGLLVLKLAVRRPTGLRSIVVADGFASSLTYREEAPFAGPRWTRKRLICGKDRAV